MRFVAIVVVCLVLLGWILAHWPSTAAAVDNPDYHWRRTAAGWERIDRWPRPQASRPALEPLLVGIFQWSFSILVLVASTDTGRLRRRALIGTATAAEIGPRDRLAPHLAGAVIAPADAASCGSVPPIDCQA